ncbi:MAG TPA: hypothetical protein VFV50_11465 [Bdellovibrionales bacterium]|nr:hypothetical protein [Bdellovibrionales bacterium]
MSPAQIKELLASAQNGKTDALRVVDFAFEHVICEGTENDIAQAVELIGAFLTEATHPSPKIGI